MTRRFDIIAAISLGILLPTLETIRRGFEYWSVSFTTMFEDYAAGVALLVAGIGALRNEAWAKSWMVMTWSGVTFMMLLSTVSQVERQLRGDIESHGLVVLVVKLLLLLTSVFALVRSIREISPTKN
jgi:hypothetical protein